MTSLTADDFPAFFEGVHGYPPFPWQKRLARVVSTEGEWPPVLDLPTGSGKTAALDIAVFHLALDASRDRPRKAPVRIAFVVDCRLVVDDAFERAQRIAHQLCDAQESSVLGRVAASLRRQAGGGLPLIAQRLRGGLPREDDWARTPAQPTIACSTVDQIGSRLLFRGYGVSDSMKPVHAGLIGSDCLILLDEAHLAEPFRQTLGWVAMYRGEKWRDSQGYDAPWGVSLLTATPGSATAETFELDEDDYEDAVLACRMGASKPARLVVPGKSGPDADDDQGKPAADERLWLDTATEELQQALTALRASGVTSAAVGVVVNRVGRARAVYERVKTQLKDSNVDAVLLIGPSRPVDRDRISAALDPIRTGRPRELPRPLVVVATQCIEAGVDIDLDGLITEAAPLDAIRQRFGRLNRAGRPITPYAAIIPLRASLDARTEDPVYGKTIGPTWDYLTDGAERHGKKDAATTDLGLNAYRQRAATNPPPHSVLSPKADAPILMPAHLDLLSQTSPIPSPDPDVALYLHGPDRQPDSVTVVWRADVDSSVQDDDQVRRLLLLLPPRSPEAIELPRWAVFGWLTKRQGVAAQLADVAVAGSDDDQEGGDVRGRVFRWTGDDDRSKWIAPREIRSGDTVVVPAPYGGLDQFGWNPEAAYSDDARRPAPVVDVADIAARPYAGRRFVVRLAPGLVGEGASASLAKALASAASRTWPALRRATEVLSLPADVRESLELLAGAKRGRVDVYDNLYGDDNGGPRGIVFVAPVGVQNNRRDEDRASVATEDDVAGSLSGYPLPLEMHCVDVERRAGEFARRAGLPAERVLDLELAAHLHDAGKADSRFQGWMHHGDRLGPDPDAPGQVLAKSGRALPPNARNKAGLPDAWRHEALSVRLAPLVQRFATAKDPDLVLWLIGTHHGHGRPLFPHADPADATARTLPRVLELPRELPAGAGPQALAFDWQGLDWAGLYARLKDRYGVWELARMEAVIRLADHRASEDAVLRHVEGDGQ